MTWFITHKPAYDADFVELPKSLQRQATQAHADLEQDPVTPRGDTIKPLKGWENLWRYRMGDHRLIYSALPENQVVQLLAIGPRADVYRRFNYDPQAEPDVELAYILDTFPIVRRKDEEQYGEYRTKSVILTVYDEMQKAHDAGNPYSQG